MERYNKYDVLSLEELYEKLIPWDNTINFNVYSEENKCSCGSVKFKRNGYYFTNSAKYQKYKCTSCGKEHRGKTNLITKERRKEMMK